MYWSSTLRVGLVLALSCGMLVDIEGQFKFTTAVTGGGHA